MAERTFFLFRHGATEITKLQAETGLPVGYGAKNLTSPLTPDASGPVTRLADYLKTVDSDINLTSGLKRCLETIDIVSAIAQKTFVVDPRLEETGKETLAETETRLGSLLADGRITVARSIVMCTHGTSISTLMNLITQKPCVENPLVQFPKPGILVIVRGNQVQELDFNPNVNL